MSQESGPQETGFSLEARKTLKDRLNYPWLMEQAIMSFRRVQTDLDKSDADMVEGVQAVINMIPSPWWDDKFKTAYDAARIVKVTDSRPSFCGQVASIDWCKEHGVPLSWRKTLSTSTSYSTQLWTCWTGWACCPGNGSLKK